MRVLGAPARRRTSNIFAVSGSHTESKSIPLSALSLDIVIAYLLRLQHSGEIGNESSKWRQLVHVTSEKNKKN